MKILPLLALASICTAPLAIAQLCRLNFPKGVPCTNNEKCLTFESSGKTYSFAKTGSYCKGADGTSGQGICCFRESVCSAYYSQSQPLLKEHGQTHQVVLCTSYDECESEKEKLKKYREYTCQNNVCCSKFVEAEKPACELTGGPVSNIECYYCEDNQYCGKQGCCDIKAWCQGTPKMLPQYNVAKSGTRLFFQTCTNVEECTQDFPNSYCSKVTGTEKKYCCPIPFSKSFKLKNRNLLPTNVLKHIKVMTQTDMRSGKSALALKLQEEAEQGLEFSKSCEKHEDCGEDEFCDEVVPRDISNAKLLKKNPKLCFPSPRCAGKAKKNPNGPGIMICSCPEDCGEDSFCDTETHRGATFPGLEELGICCRYDCKNEAIKSGIMTDPSLDAFAVLTAQKGQCGGNLDCGYPGLCIDATDQSKANYEEFPPGKSLKLCCKFMMKSKEYVYQCKTGKALLSDNGKTMSCKNDEDCNRVLGHELADPSKWDYECIKSEKSVTYCCPVHKCGDDFTYMRTELECSDPEDCMKEQEDQSDVEARAVCTQYFEKNVEKKKKRCCPIWDATKRKPYCTRRKCERMGDCQVGAYCHPTGKVCCYIGITKIDGAAHEKGGTCQGTCDDKEVFGRTVPQYCVRTGDTATGECFLSPYLKVKERNRTVNPVYKTIFIISVIFTLFLQFWP